MPWTPPDDPDPDAVLDQAEDDTRAGAHAGALAKFLWFHHHALEYQPSLSGVRLSFALSHWLELAAVYPPARAAFVRTRDEAEAAVRADPTRGDLFHDLASLNEYLGDQRRTADVFAAVAQADPAAAARLYRVAEPALLAAGRYADCGPYLRPDERLRAAAERYAHLDRWEADQDRRASGRPAEFRPPRLARRFFVEDVATLVALLALAGRPDEAAGIRGRAVAVVDDPDFRAVLAAAASGHLPPRDD